MAVAFFEFVMFFFFFFFQFFPMFFSFFFCLHFFVFFVDFLSLPLAVVTRLFFFFGLQGTRKRVNSRHIGNGCDGVVAFWHVFFWEGSDSLPRNFGLTFTLPKTSIASENRPS